MLFVGGTWWISVRCSFHLLTAKIAWGCWRVPDKHGLLHASPWSTFSVAPRIHHGLWQHAPFQAFSFMSGDVTAGSADDGDYDAAALSEVDREFNLYCVFWLINETIVIVCILVEIAAERVRKCKNLQKWEEEIPFNLLTGNRFQHKSPNMAHDAKAQKLHVLQRLYFRKWSINLMLFVW